jgi:hypothetical protein
MCHLEISRKEKLHWFAYDFIISQYPDFFGFLFYTAILQEGTQHMQHAMVFECYGSL